MRDRRESSFVVPVENEPGDLVVFVGDERLQQKRPQRQVGQAMAGRHPFFRRPRRDAGQHVARTRRRRLGQEVLEIGEDPGALADDVAVHHGRTPVDLYHPRKG